MALRTMVRQNSQYIMKSSQASTRVFPAPKSCNPSLEALPKPEELLKTPTKDSFQNLQYLAKVF